MCVRVCVCFINYTVFFFLSALIVYCLFILRIAANIVVTIRASFARALRSTTADCEMRVISRMMLFEEVAFMQMCTVSIRVFGTVLAELNSMAEQRRQRRQRQQRHRYRQRAPTISNVHGQCDCAVVVVVNGP